MPFGNIIRTVNAGKPFVAYLVGAGFMIFAAVVELILGARALGKSLENVADRDLGGDRYQRHLRKIFETTLAPARAIR